MAELVTLEGLDMKSPVVKWGAIGLAAVGVFYLLKKTNTLQEEVAPETQPVLADGKRKRHIHRKGKKHHK